MSAASPLKRRSRDVSLSSDDVYTSPPESSVRLRTDSKDKKRSHNFSDKANYPSKGKSLSPRTGNTSKKIEYRFPKRVSTSTFDLLDDKIIAKVYAALYRNNRRRSTSIYSTDDGDGSEGNEGCPLTPVEYPWFKRIFRPFLAKRKQKNLQESLIQPLPSPVIPSFQSFANLTTSTQESTCRPTIPSFEMFAAPSVSSQSEESSDEILSKYIDESFVCEVISQMFFQDYRVYCSTLDLSQAIFISGPANLQTTITVMIANFTSERVLFFQNKEAFILDRELSDGSPQSFGHDHNIIELIEFLLQQSLTYPMLENIALSLLNILRCNHTCLSIERKSGGALCSPNSVIRCFQQLLSKVKQMSLLGNIIIVTWLLIFNFFFIVDRFM